MASLNKVFVMGRLGQEPELRYTANQTAVVTLNLATSEFRMGKDGQRQEQTEWHRIVVWSKQAENCHKYLHKGSAVFIEGRLQTRSWEDKNGQKRFTTEIVANNVQFMPSGSNQTNQERGNYNPAASQDPFGGHPAGNNASSGESFSQNTSFPKAEREPVSNHSFASNDMANLDDIPF